MFIAALGALSKKKTNFKQGKTDAKGRDADDDGKKKQVDQLDNKEEIDSEDIVESW